MAKSYFLPPPRRGTLLREVANFLLQAPRYGSVVDVNPLFKQHGHMKVLKMFSVLRSRYNFYVAAPGPNQGHLVGRFEVGLWPTYHEEPRFGQLVRIIKRDPRLMQLQVEHGRPLPFLKEPARGTVLHHVWKYVQDHRKENKVCITYLKERYGTRTVHNKLNVLRNKYGFVITSVEPNVMFIKKLRYADVEKKEREEQSRLYSRPDATE